MQLLTSIEHCRPEHETISTQVGNVSTSFWVAWGWATMSIAIMPNPLSRNNKYLQHIHGKAEPLNLRARTSTPKPSCLLLSMASFEDVASEFRCLLHSGSKNENGTKNDPQDHQHSRSRIDASRAALSGHGDALPSRCTCFFGDFNLSRAYQTNERAG